MHTGMAGGGGAMKGEATLLRYGKVKGREDKKPSSNFYDKLLTFPPASQKGPCAKASKARFLSEFNRH